LLCLTEENFQSMGCALTKTPKNNDKINNPKYIFIVKVYTNY